MIEASYDQSQPQVESSKHHDQGINSDNGLNNQLQQSQQLNGVWGHSQQMTGPNSFSKHFAVQESGPIELHVNQDSIIHQAGKSNHLEGLKGRVQHLEGLSVNAQDHPNQIVNLNTSFTKDDWKGVGGYPSPLLGHGSYHVLGPNCYQLNHTGKYKLVGPSHMCKGKNSATENSLRPSERSIWDSFKSIPIIYSFTRHLGLEKA